MARITTVEKIEDNKKLKRMHLFLTPENIEKANMILNRAKHEKFDSSDSMNSIDSNVMDKISEMSRFETDEF